VANTGFGPSRVKFSDEGDARAPPYSSSLLPPAALLAR